MNIAKGCVAVAALCLGAAVQTAPADILPFHVFENAGNAPTAGLNLTVELVQQGTQLHMTFANQSTIASVFTSLYIEQTNASTTLLANPVLVQPFMPGVAFAAGASPANPPGSISGFGGPWQGTWASFGATSPNAANGVGPGESVTVRFDLLGSLGQVSAAISAGDFRMAQHVQSLGGGESLWTTTVPTPGAALALVSGGVLLAQRRRR